MDSNFSVGKRESKFGRVKMGSYGESDESVLEIAVHSAVAEVWFHGWLLSDGSHSSQRGLTWISVVVLRG